ncbi:MAG: hypothetical protein J3K34DRAFT_402523 [Monoraphidium minutum]|nr:MAG: hypothetical protein J3K34DRAFT_402523 [Monoraphidium minutum]
MRGARRRREAAARAVKMKRGGRSWGCHAGCVTGGAAPGAQAAQAKQVRPRAAARRGGRGAIQTAPAPQRAGREGGLGAAAGGRAGFVLAGRAPGSKRGRAVESDARSSISDGKGTAKAQILFCGGQTRARGQTSARWQTKQSVHCTVGWEQRSGAAGEARGCPRVAI